MTAMQALVVEDDIASAKVISHMLGKLGIEVIHFENPRVLVETRINLQEIDIIFFRFRNASSKWVSSLRRVTAAGRP